MLADRAKVKEKLVELLPKFKRKINRQHSFLFFFNFTTIFFYQVFFKGEFLRNFDGCPIGYGIGTFISFNF